jgi:hypothetical protein
MTRNSIVFSALALQVVLSSALAQTRFATVYTFTSGGPLGLSYANGSFYGAANVESSTSCGTVFELNAPTVAGGSWTETTLYTFPLTSSLSPCGPVGAPAWGPGGALYGVTGGGGPYLGGTAYELSPPASPGGVWTQETIYNFTGLGEPGGDGGFPQGLLISRTGSLFVPTSNGGTYEEGSVIELTPPASPGGTWTATPLYGFPVGPAGDDTDSVAFGPKGVLLGANELSGTTDSGTIFELSPPTSPGGAWTETTLYAFGGYADGASPNDVLAGPNGTVYGTTLGRVPASSDGVATVFQLSPPSTPGGPWTKTILKSFGYNYDCGPDSPLILRNGKLFGAACLSGGGVVFELTPPSTSGAAWTYTALHTFTNGQIPSGGMLMTKNGAIYGTTQDAAGTSGTAYEIVP